MHLAASVWLPQQGSITLHYFWLGRYERRCLPHVTLRFLSCAAGTDAAISNVDGIARARKAYIVRYSESRYKCRRVGPELTSNVNGLASLSKLSLP